MKLKWVVNSIVIMLLCMVAILGLAHRDAAIAAEAGSDKIEGILLDQITTEGSADFIIRFSEQADLSPAYSMDWDARGNFVYNTLRETADRSQANAKAILDAQGLTYETFIAGNDLYVRGANQITTNGLMVVNELAALPEVSTIRATRTYYIDPLIEVKPLDNISWAGDLLANHALSTVGSLINATLDWGITDTKADQFWTAFGVQGDGIVVANIDTGVQWNHPALDQAFKCGTNPADPACWYDPTGLCGGSACDNNGHGTHTMGTMVGDDDPNLTYEVGMAPNAEWIACKGCGTSDCSDLALNSCADWILAPGGNPANRPNVVNNSWGGGGGDPWYLAKVQAWVAAGIFPAFSAGNSGSGCSTLGSPGDYQESFASAAHDSSRTIASFSSRGPSDFGDDPYTKPNISAPGVSICSTVPTNGWSCGYSGTSMASPHTAGAVALLWSCNPSLKGQVDATFQLLQYNVDAAPDGNCNAPIDGQGNYTYGYGYLNVLNAGAVTCSGSKGTLNGHVYDTDSNPIEGAIVTATPIVNGNQTQGFTDPTGFYTLDLLAGTYNVTASKTGYTSQTANDVVIAEETTTLQDFTLTTLGEWIQIALPPGCPDWTRYDGEYYGGTGKAYFLGGRSGSNTDGTIYSYDPVANTCTDTGNDMPTPISNYTINLVNNGTNDLLCTFGGRDSDGGSTLNVQCYNPIANTISIVTNLPGAWTGYTPGAQVVVDNKVYIFGGFNSTGPTYVTARTEVYDPVAQTFTQLGNLNIARTYIMATSVDGLIYALGGDTWNGATLVASNKAEVFDPAVGTWNDAAIADLPAASGEGRGYGFDNSSSYELAGKIVLAGGGQWPAETNEALTYDVATNTYNTRFANLNVSRRDQAGFFVPGNPGVMWVFGGRTGGLDTSPYAPPEFYEVNNVIYEPDIAVTPTSLYASLPSDDTTTIPITISNIGNAPLDWIITEVPGLMDIKVIPSSTPAASIPHLVELTLDSIPASGKTTSTPKTPDGAISLVLDDGSVENNIGVGAGGYDYQFIWLNRFTPSPTNFPFNLEQIQVFFDSSIGVNAGDAIDLVVYQDADGDPSNGATWLATYNGVVQAVYGTTWSIYDLPSPLLITGPGDVLIAAINRYAVSGVSQATFPAALDTNTSQQRSWAGWWNVDPPDPAILPPNAVFDLIDNFGFAGNCMVRGYGNTLGDVPWLSENPTSGTVPVGESIVVEVTFDSTGLTPGQYLASLDIHSNDPDTPVVNVPVSLTVQYIKFFLPIIRK